MSQPVGGSCQLGRNAANALLSITPRGDLFCVESGRSLGDVPREVCIYFVAEDSGRAGKFS